MVAAVGLEPERLDADRPLAHVADPDKEPASECFAVDLRPACRVDEQVEHVLLAAVQARASLRARRSRLLRRNEVRRELAEHREQLHIVEPRVARPVDGADEVAVGVYLHRLAARRERLHEHLRRGPRAEPVDRVAADVREAAELAERPTVEAVAVDRRRRQLQSTFVAIA